MYNRYVPQPDGSYHRRQMQDASRQSPERGHAPPPPPPPEPEHCTPPVQEGGFASGQDCSSPAPWSLPAFFRQLLPRGMDTADLLILLLLLLIAGDCEEDRNNALLTVALYFIL